ncbi:MAG: hypothetical protein ACM33V_13845, partial [Chloroflexota bacterium]|nr:hypothetical protein [Anaerolineales bacterium]
SKTRLQFHKSKRDLMAKNHSNGSNPGKFTTQTSFDSCVWSVCDILRHSNCAGRTEMSLRRAFAAPKQ